MSKFITKEDKPFFIGLLIMNIILILSLEFFVMHPPEFIKKYKHSEKKEKRERHENGR